MLRSIWWLGIFGMIGLIVFLYLKGANDLYCLNKNYAEKVCEEEHWHSDHCYQVFKNRQVQECD